MKKALLQYYTFLPLLLLCGFYMYKAIAFPVHDFANYYFSGQFLAKEHFNSAIYFPYEFNKAIADLGTQNVFASYAPNTPFLAVLFVPFSFLAVAKAKLLFNCLSVVLFLISMVRLFSHYKLNRNYALLIPLLFLVPIKNELLFGQVYFLLFFLLSEGWLAYEKERWKTMAFIWSLAILLKVFPVLLLLLLVYKKQWKPLSYLILSCMLLFGISLLFTGFDIWLFYLKEVLPKASNGEIATGFVDNYQSVFMFLKRWFVYDTIENPHPLFHAAGWFASFVFAFKIGILALSYFISKKSQNPFPVFSYWMMAMLLLSPYGSTYTLILLLFPLLALLRSNLSNTKKAILCGLLFTISNLPLSLFIHEAFPFSYLRLFVLTAFTIVFIVYLFKQAGWPKTMFVSGLAIVLGSFFNHPVTQKSESVLTANSPILIYDYTIENNRLTYFYWNEKGENKEVIPFDSKSCKSMKLNDKRLTFDKSNKRKPVLVSGKTIYYLSDFDRGIGFFTLRKINLL